jgi:hypothetical protein
MATASNTSGSGQPDEATLGLGGDTSGQAGATPTHETQAETGGSGGAQLTHSHGEVDAPAGGRGKPAPPDAADDAPDSAMQSGSRGALDTRPQQGGGTGTGLGSRESGGNQSEEDLPPP